MRVADTCTEVTCAMFLFSAAFLTPPGLAFSRAGHLTYPPPCRALCPPGPVGAHAASPPPVPPQPPQAEPSRAGRPAREVTTSLAPTPTWHVGVRFPRRPRQACSPSEGLRKGRVWTCPSLAPHPALGLLLQLLRSPDVAASVDDATIYVLAEWFQCEDPATVKLLLRVVEIFRQHGTMVTGAGPGTMVTGAGPGPGGPASAARSPGRERRRGGAVCPLATGQAALGSEQILVRPGPQPPMAAPPGRGKGRVTLEDRPG